MREQKKFGLFLVFAISCSSTSALAEAVMTLPITAHVAQVDGAPVVPGWWIEGQIDRANEVYRPYKMAFALVERTPLSTKHARLETRDDRDALGALVKGKVINWFVVASLRDVDDPSRYRQGVHWHPRGMEGVHLVVVSKIAGQTVLAHELGHFLGNRPHSPVPGNLMSYERGDGLPFFSATQARRLKRFTRRFLDSGELVPAGRLSPRR